MTERRQVSLGRKLAFYGGYLCMAAGFLLFLSAFWPFFGGPASFRPSALGLLALRAAGGLVLMLLGRLLRRIGILGLAGSVVILDPPKAREDLEPWSRAAGGLLGAAISELSALKRPGEPTAATPTATQARCSRCEASNDLGARFCNQCGEAL